MQKKNLSAYAGCLLALCLASCKGDETTAAQPTFSIVGNPTTLTVPWDGITQSYDVETNGEWSSAVDGGSWLTVTPSHSAYNGAIKVRVAQTGSNMPRSGSITFTVDDKTVHTLAVTQEGLTLQGIALSHTSLALELGELVQVTATPVPDNNAGIKFSWTSSNTAVVTVSGTGLVTSLGAGEASITVATTDNVLTTELPVQVLDGPDEPSGEQMPIMTWYGPFPVSGETERHFRELREAGFTHNFSHNDNVAEITTQLNAAQAAGVKNVINTPADGHTYEETVVLFKDHPALAGYNLSDEPSSSRFTELNDIAQRIQAIDNTHFCYINLLPNYASTTQLGSPTYLMHVQDYIQRVDVPFISFDHYPIQLLQQKREVRSGWYENLEIIASEAKKANKPFWAFALSTQHYNYPIPTIDDLRLQVYSDLAYGAQCIQYFTYWLPNDGNSTVFTGDAPVDWNGNKSPTYALVQAMNREITNLSKVFLNANVLSVTHTGSTIPQGTMKFTSPPTGIKSLSTEGEGAIVSVLEKGNSNYLVVVNRDINGSMGVNIEGTAALKKVRKSGAMVAIGTGGKMYLVPPGDALIFTWAK